MSRPLALSLILLALSIALPPGRAQQNQLIGRWRSVDASPSGVRAIFEFHSDGQLDSYSAAFSEDEYRLIGTDTILLQSKSGPEQKLELEWDSQDRARIEDEAAGKIIPLTRAGKMLDTKNQLSGEWITTREWNGKNYPARALFSSDGKVIWITELRTDHGHYSITSKTIRLEIASRPVVEGGFAVTADHLTLPNPRGGDATFERF